MERLYQRQSKDTTLFRRIFARQEKALRRNIFLRRVQFAYFSQSNRLDFSS